MRQLFPTASHRNAGNDPLSELIQGVQGLTLLYFLWAGGKQLSHFTHRSFIILVIIDGGFDILPLILRGIN